MEEKNKKINEEKKINFFRILGNLFILYIIISFISTIIIGSYDLGYALGNTAIINLKGEITTESQQEFLTPQTLNSEGYAKLIRKAADNENIKIIILKINSPGGSAVGSKEIVDAIKYAKTKKPIVSYIRELGASGAYWAAANTEYIMSNDLAIVGSVGVLASHIDFSGLMEKYGIKYEKLTGGKYKDIGSPLRNITPEEKKLLQQKIDLIHKEFYEDVFKERQLENLSKEKKEMIKTGIFFIGKEALNYSLIDKTGSYEEFKKIIKQKYNLTEIKEAKYMSSNTNLGLLQLKYNNIINLFTDKITNLIIQNIISKKTFTKKTNFIKTEHDKSIKDNTYNNIMI